VAILNTLLRGDEAILTWKEGFGCSSGRSSTSD
jgi:hypothetical protein